jgi:hypothetical protein
MLERVFAEVEGDPPPMRGILPPVQRDRHDDPFASDAMSLTERQARVIEMFENLAEDDSVEGIIVVWEGHRVTLACLDTVGPGARDALLCDFEESDRMARVFDELRAVAVSPAYVEN